MISVNMSASFRYRFPALLLLVFFFFGHSAVFLRLIPCRRSFKYLDALDFTIRYVDVAFSIYGYPGGTIELTVSFAFGTPFAQEFSFRVENLYPVVPAVGHVHQPCVVCDDVVGNAELAWKVARLSPRE